MQGFDFNIFSKNYLWYSSLFYCHKNSEYFEQPENESLELIRIMHKKINFDFNEKTAEFSSTILAPLNTEIENKNIFIKQPANNLILVTKDTFLENIDSVIFETTDNNSNYIAFIEQNSYKLMVVENLFNDGLLFKFLVMDSSPVSNDNSAGTEGRIIITDEEVEPPFNSQGYILPSLDLKSII